MKPELSIVITSYKKTELLKLCIESLKNNIKNIDYEIVVADSETEESTFDLMRENFPTVKFVPNKINTGFLVLANQGIDLAEGEYIFVINADIIAKDNSLFEMLEFLKDHEDVGMVGPKLINFDNSIQASYFRFYTPMTVIYRRTFLNRFSFAKKKLDSFLMKDSEISENGTDVDWLMGSAMLVSKKALGKVGKMDKRFFLYFEDVDWCWRFWENSFRVVYFPKAEFYHYHGKRSASQKVIKSILLNKYTRIHISSGIKFFLKHFGKKNPRKAYESEMSHKK